MYRNPVSTNLLMHALNRMFEQHAEEEFHETITCSLVHIQYKKMSRKFEELQLDLVQGKHFCTCIFRLIKKLCYLHPE